MNIAMLKLGSRVSYDKTGKSGGIGEVLSIIDILLIGRNHRINFYTKNPSNENKPNENIKFHSIYDYENINDDILIVINGNVNFFGGCECREEILNYKIINSFKGKVFYFLCDPNLTLKNIWKSIEKKEWGHYYNKEDIFITRKDIICVTQAKKIELIDKLHQKNGIFFNDVIYFPFEKFPLLKGFNKSIENFEVDLIYGGTFRSGRREKDIVKFLFGYDKKYKIEIFGNISLDQFKEKLILDKNLPLFSKAVEYKEYIDKIRTSLSTIIIGDTLYKKLDNLAQRAYESIAAGHIVFIDSDYDREKRIFENQDILQKFCYVNSREDIEKRLDWLKEFPENITKIIKLQQKAINFDKDEYSNTLREILEI